MSNSVIWYHPFRMDSYLDVRKKQGARLRERLERSGTPAPKLDRAVERALAKDDRLRDDGSYETVSMLTDIRKNHALNGGPILNMEWLSPHFFATDAGTIDLATIRMPASAIYLHLGTDFRLVPVGAPDRIFEGVYVSRTGEGWSLAFVFDYPDWELAEHQMPSVTEKCLGSAFQIEMDSGARIGAAPGQVEDFFGDPDVADDPDLQWLLVNMTFNALLWLSQEDPDANPALEFEVWGTMRKHDVWKCGISSVPNPDQMDFTKPFRSGRWVSTTYGNPPRIKPRWLMPTWTDEAVASSHTVLDNVVLAFRGRPLNA